MSENNYVVSGKGFFKATKLIYDMETSDSTLIVGTEMVWVDNIRNAKKFSGKSARNLIKNHGLDAFVWSPFKEEPIKNKYEVVRRNEYKSFYEDEIHNVLEWIPRKVVMESLTDVKYLNSINSKPAEYYDQDEAIKVAREKNMAILIELETKMNMQNVIKQVQE